MTARRTLPFVIAMLAVAAGAGTANAATYCVNDASCVAGGGVSEPGVQAALDAAHAGNDVVAIGPGVYPGTDVTGSAALGFSWTASAGEKVTIAGAGVGQTVLEAVPGTHATSSETLHLEGNVAGSTLSNLTVESGSTSGTTLIGLGIENFAVDHVTVAPAAATPVSTLGALQIDGGTNTISDSTLTGDPSGSSAALFASSAGSTTTVQRSVLSGMYAAYSNPNTTLDVFGSQLTGLGSAAAYGYGHLTLADDTVLASGPGQDLIHALASGSTSAVFDVRNVTAVGRSGDTGVVADGTGGGGSHNTTVNLDSSIVTGAGTSVKTIQGGDVDVVNTSYSDVGTTSGSHINGLGTDLMSVDPQFVDPAGNFHLRFGSALIDAGNPAALVAGDPTVDEAGAPRIAGARRDIGAFEYGFNAPTAVIAPPPTGIVAPTAVTFDGSGSSDPDPGDTLTYAWTFDDGATGTGPTVSHAFLTPGLHTVTLTVTDPSGRSGTTTATIAIGAKEIPRTPKPSVSFGSTRLRLSSTGHIAVSLRCAAASGTQGCSGKLTIGAELPVAKSKHKHATHASKLTQIAVASFSIKAGKTKTIEVKLTSAARARVASAGHLTATATAIVRVGTTAGKATTKTLTIVRPPKKPKPKKKHKG